ncbi:hypothetical protein ES705_41780 [subsurface metagenome]
MIALSLSALSFLFVDRTMVPGPGSRSISVPLKLSHRPPEARIWLATIILAPAVPRKVMVSLDGLLASIASVTIEHGCIFYNCPVSFDVRRLAG